MPWGDLSAGSGGAGSLGILIRGWGGGKREECVDRWMGGG